METITREEFNKFLEELNVVISDIAVNPKMAWKHYNENIFNIHTKENLIRKGGDTK